MLQDPGRDIGNSSFRHLHAIALLTCARVSEVVMPGEYIPMMASFGWGEFSLLRFYGMFKTLTQPGTQQTANRYSNRHREQRPVWFPSEKKL
jgi:hypothetical protein